MLFPAWDVSRRARRQKEYKPVMEDWVFHTVLPFASYVSVLVAALALPRQRSVPLFAIGGSAALLLFVGIHNAWDTVTFIIVTRWERRRARDERTSDKES